MNAQRIKTAILRKTNRLAALAYNPSSQKPEERGREGQRRKEKDGGADRGRREEERLTQ